jgi:hypothetical protein
MVRRMRNAALPCLKTLAFVVLLCLFSCRTESLVAAVPKSPAKVSPAQERYKKPSKIGSASSGIAW